MQHWCRADAVFDVADKIRGNRRQFFALTLTLGFLGLCFVEGGENGHALAWLVSVPLCSFILLGERQATWWLVISFLAAAIVIVAIIVAKLTTTANNIQTP